MLICLKLLGNTSCWLICVYCWNILSHRGAVLDAYDDISEDDPSPTPDLETVHDQTTRETGVIADILSSPSLTNAR